MLEPIPFSREPNCFSKLVIVEQQKTNEQFEYANKRAWVIETLKSVRTMTVFEKVAVAGRASPAVLVRSLASLSAMLHLARLPYPPTLHPLAVLPQLGKGGLSTTPKKGEQAASGNQREGDD